MNDLFERLYELRTFFIKMAINIRETNPGKSFECFKHSQTCEEAATIIERTIPKEKEIEGGGSTWRYVCLECHGQIDSKDKYCKHCGQALK